MTDRVKKRFLDHYAKHGRVIKACEWAHITPTTHRKCMKRDPEYRQCFEDAELAFAEFLEAELIARGMEGVVETIFDKNGKEIGLKTKYSDSNLRRAVEARNKRYQQRVDHNHNIASGSGVLIVPAVSQSSEDWARTYSGKPKNRIEAELDTTKD